MNIIYKTPEQIVGIRKACQLATHVLNTLGQRLEIGMQTKTLDEMAAQLMKEAGAVSATYGYQDTFPSHICVSPNHGVCHGIPNEYVIKDGDLISIDVALILDGYFGDTCQTFLVGNADPLTKQFVDVCYHSMMRGIKQVYPGNRLSNIGYSIQKYVEKKGYSVVREYCGHGVGLHFHEDPQVMHYGRKNRGITLKEGMTFTIEPMINMGDYDIVVDKKDGWSVYSKDRSLSAQFEHTILVTKDGCEILT
jgi:methionyl aminopeptidase